MSPEDEEDDDLALGSHGSWHGTGGGRRVDRSAGHLSGPDDLSSRAYEAEGPEDLGVDPDYDDQPTEDD